MPFFGTMRFELPTISFPVRIYKTNIILQAIFVGNAYKYEKWRQELPKVRKNRALGFPKVSPRKPIGSQKGAKGSQKEIKREPK